MGSIACHSCTGSTAQMHATQLARPAIQLQKIAESAANRCSDAQAYHATEETELGKPRQVDADTADSGGPWTVFWSQTAPQVLRFKVGCSSAACAGWLVSRVGCRQLRHGACQHVGRPPSRLLLCYRAASSNSDACLPAGCLTPAPHLAISHLHYTPPCPARWQPRARTAP